MLVLAQFLKSRIATQRIEHGIEAEHRRSERRLVEEGIEIALRKAEMARSGSPIRAAT